MPLFGICGVIASEVADGATFTCAMVGSTPRTYVALPASLGPAGAISTASTGGLKLAMLWE